MTKRDFFILLIKVFGLYSIITTLFSVIPNSLSSISLDFGIAAILWSIFGSGIAIGITVILLSKADKVVQLLKLDKGFDDDRIDFGNIKPSDIVKIGSFIIGGFLILNNIPNFISHALFSYKSEVVGYEYTSKQYFQWAVSGVNILLGLFLFTKYDLIAKWFRAEKKYS